MDYSGIVELFIVTNNLNTLRKQIKTKLQNLTPKSRAISSKKIATKIINSDIFIHSQNIACYIPIENEVDTRLIIETIWQQGKNCYLPAFASNTKKCLCFVKFMPNDSLLKVNEKIISPKNLDLVIVPLIGFNSDNFRLGRGAGCYDITFEFKLHIKNLSKPYLLGIGYKWQHIKFEPNLWDVAMDEIITDLSG